MWSERDETRELQTGERDGPAADVPDVHRFNLPPKARTRETIAVVATLAALFLLLFLLVGHPAAPHALVHPHATSPHAVSSAH